MNKHNKREKGFPALLMIGAGVSLASVALTSFAMAIASSFTKDPTSLTGAMSLVSLLLAGVISAMINALRDGAGGALIATLSSAIAAVLMLAAGLVIKGGLLPFGTLINHTAFVGISALTAALTKRRPKKRKRRYGY